MRIVEPVRTINARSGKISWNWARVEDAHISYLLDREEVSLNALTTTKAASVVEYIATRESIRKCANVCRTLSDEEIEILTNYAALNADESSYLRVLTFMLKEGLYDNCVLYLPMTRNLRAGINDDNTTVYDRSNFGNHGTIYGAVWQSLGSGKSVLSYDGVDDYVDCGKDESLNVGSGDFTITAWIKLTSDGINTVAGKKGSNYGASPGYMLTVDDGVLYFTMGDGSNSFKSSGFAGVNDGQWHFVAGVRNGSIAYVYFDEQNKSDDCSAIGDVNNDRNFYVGRKGYVGNFFNGTIDEVRIYNRALSEEEIKRLYELTRVFYGV